MKAESPDGRPHCERIALTSVALTKQERTVMVEYAPNDPAWAVEARAISKDYAAWHAPRSGSIAFRSYASAAVRPVRRPIPGGTDWSGHRKERLGGCAERL
jgi:hypothetical protein